MKFIHFSDTHLGFSDYHRIDSETGINQREQDFYNAWQHIIEQVLIIKPDFVIHAGDLFHTSRPTNRAIAIAFEGIQQISDSGIPFIIISGNHSTPKIRSTGSIFESIKLLPNVFAAYQSAYEKFKIKNSVIHCIPHCSLTEELEAAFKQIKPDTKSTFNILTTHGSWAGEKSFSMGEFNEQHIQDPELVMGFKFNYIALGHYHKHIEIKPHIIYSGSTERTSFNEAGNPTGFMFVDLEKNKIEYKDTPSRSMIKTKPIDCSSLSSAEIYRELEKLSTLEMQDALVSVHLENVQHDTLIKLENREIDNIFNQVFYLNKTITRITTTGKSESNSINLGSLPMEFERYIDEIKEGEIKKDKLKTLGLEYLNKEI